MRVRPIILLLKWPAIMVVVLASLYFLVTSSLLHGTFSALRIIPEDEKVTEVYFDPATPASRSYQPNSPIAVSFIIQNQEDQTLHYAYEVRAYQPQLGTDILLKNASVNIEKNSAKTFNERIDMSQFKERIKLEVKVRYNRKQYRHDSTDIKTLTINYWLREEN